MNDASSVWRNNAAGVGGGGILTNGVLTAAIAGVTVYGNSPADIAQL
jgi:hypothetical protein